MKKSQGKNKQSVSKLSFADCGIYNEAISFIGESLNWQVQLPPKISNESVRLGIRYSPEMICYPYKVTLGNIIQLIESGVENILTYNTNGHCRFTHFHTLYRNLINELNYDCNILTIDSRHLLRSFRQSANGKLSFRKLVPGILKAKRSMLESEERESEKYEIHPIKIAVIGEAYSCIIPEINFNVRDHLLKLKISTVIPAAISYYFKDKYFFIKKQKADKLAKKLVSSPLAGCGYETLKNTYYACLNGFHGIVHIYPLTCMPETTVNPLIESIAREYDVPLLNIEIDENMSHLNVQNRLDAFAEIIKLKVKNER